MSKAAISRLFVGGLVAVVAGIVLEVVAVLGIFAGGVLVIGGPSVVEVNGGSFAWLVVVLMVLGVGAMAGGTIAALVSWIGALSNTFQLEDKTWFAVLLVLGLLSFGFVAMIAYVLAGPDSSQPTVSASDVPTTAGA